MAGARTGNEHLESFAQGVSEREGDQRDADGGERADFKSFEEQGWTINTSVMGGLEWWGTQATRRFRMLLNYYHGFNPYGQFFSQKVETFGVGLYLAF